MREVLAVFGALCLVDEKHCLLMLSCSTCKQSGYVSSSAFLNLVFKLPGAPCMLQPCMLSAGLQIFALCMVAHVSWHCSVTLPRLSLLCQRLLRAGAAWSLCNRPCRHAGTLNSGLPHLIDKLRYVLYGKHRRTFVDASYGACVLCLPLLAGVPPPLDQAACP